MQALEGNTKFADEDEKGTLIGRNSFIRGALVEE